MKRGALAVLITASVCATVSAAGVFVTVDDVTVTSSATLPVDSFFDIFFEIEPPVTLPDLAGYQVAIDLDPTASGVALGVPTNPSAPHAPIYPGTPPANLGSTADRIQATAFVAVGAEVPIVDGAGIIRVPFEVAAGTNGMFDATIDVSNTVLADGNASPILYMPRDGKINVVLPAPQLAAGDANQDLEFSFDDILLVLGSGKFETGDPATWGEGDWDGAPGGSPGNPPAGDGLFRFDDILDALSVGHFETGPYAANGSATEVVPEPSTFLLLSVSVLALVATRHRHGPVKVNPKRRHEVPVVGHRSFVPFLLLRRAAILQLFVATRFRIDQPFGTPINLNELVRGMCGR